MHLIRVEIEEFKNLRHLQIDFDSSSPYTVLVGENGAGKSNLLEAITVIFRHLDLDERASFGFAIRYSCNIWDVVVEAEQDHAPRAWVREMNGPAGSDYVALTRKQFQDVDDDDRPLYRPTFVFGYYSGPGDRLAKVYERHRERFYSHIIRPRREKRPIDPNTLRRLFYSETLHGQFALLAFFMDESDGPGSDREFLRERLQISGLDSVLFCLNRPPWRPRSGGDKRFWGAEGEVRTFLDAVYDAALLPIRQPRRMSLEFAKSQSIENLYLFLPGMEALRALFQSYPDQYAFFTALESTHLSKLLGEVLIRVKVQVGDEEQSVTYRDLSEGEQQLLLVLGLLRFTARDEALFLLDEPDTHLNPSWSAEYLSFLDRFIRVRDMNSSCHIVMSTHDPLVFSRLLRSQVVIMRRSSSGIAMAEVPDEDPRGMGVAAILTSDLFRLRSTLDLDTQRDLDRQRILAEADRSPEEELELAELTTRLSALGLARTTRDPLFELFTSEWVKRRDASWDGAVQLSADQMAERRQLAETIVSELLDEQVE